MAQNEIPLPSPATARSRRRDRHRKNHPFSDASQTVPAPPPVADQPATTRPSVYPPSNPPAPNPSGSEEGLMEVLARYEVEGFNSQFSARTGGNVLCHACDQLSEPAAVSLFALHRFEGASDPGEEMACAAIECPKCRRRGTVTLTYGPLAPPDDAMLLKALTDLRGLTGIAPGK